MKVAFLGTSHAAQHLASAAMAKGFGLAEPEQADLVFVSEDTPTDAGGERDLHAIRSLVWAGLERRKDGVPLVITSAVPPGFTRHIAAEERDVLHQAETLRIKDAEKRALFPEMIIVGTEDPLP